MRKETVIASIYSRRLNGSILTGCSCSGYRKLQNRMKYYCTSITYAVILFVTNIRSNTFRKHFSQHRFATFFGQYFLLLSEVHNIQYTLKIDNKQYQDIKLQNIARCVCLCGAVICPDYQLRYVRVPIWESKFYCRNRQEQCFPNNFAREPLLVSKNNQESSHPCSRKYRLSGRELSNIQFLLNSYLILDS